MSQDEAERLLERQAASGDAAAKKALLDARIRERGLASFVCEVARELLGSGPLSASLPMRDGCGAVVRMLADSRDGRRGAWVCPVCGVRLPYVFWEIKSDPSGSRQWLPGEVVLALSDDACPVCGELSGPASPPPLDPSGARLKEEITMHGLVKQPGHGDPECMCQRKRRVLTDELRGLEGKIAMWRRDLEALDRSIEERSVLGEHVDGERLDRLRADRLKIASEIESMLAKSEEIKRDLTEAP